MAKKKSRKTTEVKKSIAKKPVKAAKKAAVKTKKATPKKKSTTGKAKAKKKGETLECFLTTACVKYYALPDNGYELTTLRIYRDGYLTASPGGKELIREYYNVSPKIVALVNNDKEKESVYEFIYSKVLEACTAIEEKKNKTAKKVYVGLVRSLMHRYNLN